MFIWAARSCGARLSKGFAGRYPYRLDAAASEARCLMRCEPTQMGEKSSPRSRHCDGLFLAKLAIGVSRNAHPLALCFALSENRPCTLVRAPMTACTDRQALLRIRHCCAQQTRTFTAEVWQWASTPARVWAVLVAAGDDSRICLLFSPQYGNSVRCAMGLITIERCKLLGFGRFRPSYFGRVVRSPLFK